MKVFRYGNQFVFLAFEKRNARIITPQLADKNTIGNTDNCPASFMSFERGRCVVHQKLQPLPIQTPRAVGSTITPTEAPSAAPRHVTAAS